MSPAERRANPAQRARGRPERRRDPFAPDNNPELWARLVVVDSHGREMFEPKSMEASFSLRYAHRDPLVGMDITIWRKMHPQPVMTVNNKIYPVTLKEGGWRRVAEVTADVGQREFEREWFTALEDQTAILSDLPGYPEGAGASETLRVERASFGRFQRIVVVDDNSTVSRAGYEGRLTLRETIPSFLGRQLAIVLENSFVIAATALAAGGVGYLGNVLRDRRRVPERRTPGPRGRGTKRR